MTWRSSKAEGGGCLYDYACHAIDLVNFLHAAPNRVEGTILNKVFSTDVDDEVYATFFFPDGATGQLAANWSDESFPENVDANHDLGHEMAACASIAKRYKST